MAQGSRLISLLDSSPCSPDRVVARGGGGALLGRRLVGRRIRGLWRGLRSPSRFLDGPARLWQAAHSRFTPFSSQMFIFLWN